MSPMNLIFHLPPLWLPQSKTLALEVSAEGEAVICLITSEELHRRYNTRPGLDGTEALATFDTFHDEIESDIRSLLEGRWLSRDGGEARSPRVLNLGAAPELWCFPAPSRPAAAGAS